MTILGDIIAGKRDEVAARKRETPPSGLDVKIAAQTAPRGFRATLDRTAYPKSARAELVEALSFSSSVKRKDGPSTSSGRTVAEPVVKYALIAEIKRASPSKGLIRSDFDPAAHARDYAAGGATCLSVLTDERWFQGANAALAEARDACVLPVLRKDFVIDPWQVAESRALGADAILLIVAALDDTTLAELEAAAIELGMDVLVEVHDADELDRALRLKSRLIGINSRDLKDFSINLDKIAELACQAPPGCTIIAESGLNTRADLDALAEHGIRCFLVGEALMRRHDIEIATRELVG